ncbi:possible monooxygenase/ hydrolase (plasmid) [Rhodococcus jostii RHA1]|uniref:Possible monooxygenase/ hydrolase n=1 Tax=Rhodococcus jostii (strain RHA1) TaxID=101510 RepID=Q0RV68_RHOJR|nr:FAD-dependent oxidoreductase [Rhodococcus jostii]ABH00818.1 possible monooxygenase/ hydrolase [Rhodococcus jostii RHA1]
MAETYDTPVLIIGGGPVGFATALDLAWRGCESMIVEREADGTQEFRAKATGLDERSMEQLRRWGLHDQVLEVGFPVDFPFDTVYCTSLTGYPMGRSLNPSIREEIPPVGSSEKRYACPQWELDKLLVESATASGLVEVRWNSAYGKITQDADGVTTEIIDAATGESSTIRSKYVVASDGAGSAVRRSLGIPFEGPQLDFSLNITIRIPKLELPEELARAQRYLLIDEDGTWGVLTHIDGREIWRLTVVGAQDELDADTYDHMATVRRALGSGDIPFEVIRCVPWRRSQSVAATYRQGRVFLAGDSAHTMSPTGGHGLNTGLGDVSDLGWILEAALSGWGGKGLLDAYERERRPIGLRNGRKATGHYRQWVDSSNYVGVTQEGPEGDVTRKRVGDMLVEALKSEWHSPGTALGFRYEGSPIIVDDGTPEPADDPIDYVPTARPGHRAPHVALSDGSSILALFGHGFVLLRIGAADLDTSAFESAGAAAGVPLRVEKLDEPAVAEMYERKLVLVRPDGHVAWRGDVMPDDAAGVIDVVRGAAATGGS